LTPPGETAKTTETGIQKVVKSSGVPLFTENTFSVENNYSDKLG